MPPSAPAPFHVSQLTGVTQAVRELLESARAAGNAKEMTEVLRLTIGKLKADPISWGEAQFHPKKAGSVVCQRIWRGISVRYAVFEQERKVMILEIKAYPEPA